MGAVTDSVRRLVPATYDAMLFPDPSSGTPALYLTTDLQILADYVKYKLFATAVNSTQEASVYNQFENQFLGKLTTLQLIPAAVDFWDSRLASIVSTGTGENVQFRDHRDGLLKLYDILSKEVKEDAQILGISLRKAGLLPQVSYGDGGRGILKTPDPLHFPRFRHPRHFNHLPDSYIATN